MTGEVDPAHLANAETAKALFIASKNPRSGAHDWHFALRRARRIVAAALRASDYLRDVPRALMEGGSHMRVYRHFMAPPMSQDQFKLICKVWSKGSENNNQPLTSGKAAEVSAAFLSWRDPGIGRWLEREAMPTRQEVREVLLKIAPLIASQDLATLKRNEMANKQEQEVVDLLLRKGWTKLPSKLIDERAAVPTKNFMHKTRFATSTTASQEVDVACGLKGTYVTAMECKVTNDETNSVKRVNDIIKKAKAWQDHWGSFVVTAALLQGVVAAKDVQRLTDNKIKVFWSHDLNAFGKWIDSMS
tara:strand:+ start:327 stop:1235 length:909 start_codon:yes stop_codon:yes gene_type:complete